MRQSEGPHSAAVQLISRKSWRLNVNTVCWSRFGWVGGGGGGGRRGAGGEGECCFISPRKGEQSIGVQSGSLLRERGRGDNFHRFTKAERR